MSHEQNRTSEINLSEQWFILKGENRYGPYSYMDIVRFLQQKLVFEFDYVWKAGFEDWERIAGVQEFSKEKMLELKKNNSEISEMFFRRNHKRVKFDGDIVIHNNKIIWYGKAVEISVGGVGVIMQNSLCVPGDHIQLHFRPTLELEAFNVICEVVSKKFVKAVKGTDTPIRYGLKFINLNKEIENKLKNYSEYSEAA